MAFNINTFTTTNQILTNGESGFVGASGGISVVAASAIVADGSFSVVVLGNVSAKGGMAIQTTSGVNATIQIGAAASVSSPDNPAISLAVTSGANIVNAGSVFGDIVLTGTGQLLLTNRGTIFGDISASTDSDTFRLRGGIVTGTVDGGDGADIYIVDRDDLTLFEDVADGDIDIVRSSANFSLDSGFETLELTGTADLKGWIGHADGATLTGNIGDNQLFGGDGGDTISGKGGLDRLVGGLGDDIYINDGVDVIVELSGGGTDTVQSSTTVRLINFIENLELTGTSAISGTGNTLANEITGNAGNNVINGMQGKDTLTGAGGNDTFVFSTALGSSNVDEITDFVSADDTIRLDNAVFAGLAAGKLSSAALVQNMTGNAEDVSDRIIYEVDTGKLYFDADGTGGIAKQHFATIDLVLTLNNSDFVVF